MLSDTINALLTPPRDALKDAGVEGGCRPALPFGVAFSQRARLALRRGRDHTSLVNDVAGSRATLLCRGPYVAQDTQECLAPSKGSRYHYAIRRTHGVCRWRWL